MTQAAVSQLEQRTDIYLSTLENFVEAMGGTITASNRVDQHGAVFTIRLPVRTHAEVEAAR